MQRMIFFRYLLVSLFSLSLMACTLGATKPGMVREDAATAKRQLARQAACCQQLNQLVYADLTQKSFSTAITPASPVFEFNTGKTPVLAYRLPVGQGSYTLSIESQVDQEYLTVFSPSALVLDKQFQPLRLIDADHFKYVPAYLLTPDALVGKLSFSGVNEYYLVIFTTAQSLAESSTLLAPERAFAQATNRADPGIPNPIAQHSPYGKLYIEMDADFELKPAPVEHTATQVQVQPAVTKRDYDLEIRQALQQKKFEQALQLMKQAEAAGSTSARQTYIDTLQQMLKSTPPGEP